MKVTVVLLKAWQDPTGKDHAKGTVLRLDDWQAEELVESDIAKKYDAKAASADAEAREKQASSLQEQVKEEAEKQVAELAGISIEEFRAFREERGNGGSGEGKGAGRKLVFAEAKDEKAEAKGGFDNFADYCKAVHKSTTGGAIDKRFGQWATKTQSETVGADGGFLVPPEFSTALWQLMFGETALLSSTMQLPVAGNQLTIPALTESSRADGSRYGGVRMYWGAEAGTKTASDAQFRKIMLTMHKLYGVVRVSDEIIEDSAITLEPLLMNLFASEMRFVLEDALINGTGAGQPRGILNSAATNSIAKETGQAAATIVGENIVKMFTGMLARHRQRAVWLIGSEAEAELLLAGVTYGTTSIPMYLPPTGLTSSPYGTLYGRPVIPHESCAALGTVGDILFCDWGSYVTATKAGYPKQASSMHLYFLTDEMAFRIVMRIDGQPGINNTITMKDGSTRGVFVSLATRS